MRSCCRLSSGSRWHVAKPRSDNLISCIVAICAIILFPLVCDKSSMNEADRAKMKEKYERTIKKADRIEAEIRGMTRGGEAPDR